MNSRLHPTQRYSLACPGPIVLSCLSPCCITTLACSNSVLCAPFHMLQTVRVATTSQQVVSENSGDGGIGFDDRDTRDPHPPPSCHPGLVGPLPTLAVVVTLAEAVVDCLLDGKCHEDIFVALRPSSVA